MASIEQTAYPRFTDELLEQTDLQKLFSPSEAELAFVKQHSRKASGNLSLLILLKTHQYLGRSIGISKVPVQIKRYLAEQLDLTDGLETLAASEANKITFHRYRKAIRDFLTIQPWSEKAEALIMEGMKKAAFTMSDPADLINIALSVLADNQYEIPAFGRLDESARHIRQVVHEQLYKQTLAALRTEEQKILDDLLLVQGSNYRSMFTNLKTAPGRNTLPQMRRWAQRLEELNQLIQAAAFIQHISYTKIRQFAAQANALEVSDIKDISSSAKRYTFLLCFLHEAQMRTRDELMTMFLKRMRQTHSRAKEHLEQIKAQYRLWEEQMMQTLQQVVDSAVAESKDKALGKRVRTILAEHGGAATISKRYKIVSAYHGDNHLPLLWSKHKAHRSAIYKLLNLLEIKSATEDTDLLTAFEFIKKQQNARRDYLPMPACTQLNLDFLSLRWQAYVQTKQEGETLLKRRELEVCILSHLADAIRYGDLYITGSQEFTDFRTQLLSWDACLPHLEAYCVGVGLANNATDFVAVLQEKLRKTCQSADDFFPKNTHFSIDELGQAHLKRLRAKEKPKELKVFQQKIRALMPERHLLDILKNVAHWTNFTQYFSPPSGAKAKMKDAVSRYIFTVFGYGCNLGAAQTAKHIRADITLRTLKRINDQHINPEKLQQASTNIIDQYARFELPYLWGTGKSAAADGTHIQLLQNNLMGEQHIRYNGYGGIAYHHISDTYVALFCNFIACGVWEAVYILDGLMKNTAKLQPDTIHADTQGQSQPVFGLSYLLGIQLMPRMRNWNEVTFYKTDKTDSYQHIDELFTDTIDWDLIKTHWKDLMQVVISIHQGKVLPSMLLQKLGTNNRKNKLYKAFRELGRVIRTIFLLDYASSEQLRRKIQATSNKVESFHFFHDWITFGGFIITTGDPVEQHKRNKYIDLIANAVMLHNVVDLTNAINTLVKDGEKVSPELLAFLSPYLTEHIKRFGQYVLDTNEPPEPILLRKLDFSDK